MLATLRNAGATQSWHHAPGASGDMPGQGCASCLISSSQVRILHLRKQLLIIQHLTEHCPQHDIQ